MEIRANNLKKMRACSGQDQYHSHAIVEDAALEDLCEEAGVEAEKIEVNGKMNTKEKNKVLTHLSQNVQTKKHFQVWQTYALDRNVLTPCSEQANAARVYRQ